MYGRNSKNFPQNVRKAAAGWVPKVKICSDCPSGLQKTQICSDGAIRPRKQPIFVRTGHPASKISPRTTIRQLTGLEVGMYRDDDNASSRASCLYKCWYFAGDRIFFPSANPFALDPFFKGMIIWSVKVDKILSSHCVGKALSVRDNK